MLARILSFSLVLLFFCVSGFSQTTGTTASATTKPKNQNSFRSDPDQRTKEARKYAKKQERAIKREDKRRARYLKRCAGTKSNCSFDWRDY